MIRVTGFPWIQPKQLPWILWEPHGATTTRKHIMFVMLVQDPDCHDTRALEACSLSWFGFRMVQMSLGLVFCGASWKSWKSCNKSWSLISGALYAVIRLVFFIVVTRRRDIPFVHGAPKNLQQIQRSFSMEGDAQENFLEWMPSWLHYCNL